MKGPSRHMHHWMLVRDGVWMAWTCDCGATRSTIAKKFAGGRPKRKRVRTKKTDLSAAEIEALFQRAQAQQRYQRKVNGAA